MNVSRTGNRYSRLVSPGRCTASLICLLVVPLLCVFPGNIKPVRRHLLSGPTHWKYRGLIGVKSPEELVHLLPSLFQQSDQQAGTKAPCSLDPLSIGLVDVVREITIRLQLWRIGTDVLVAINGKPSESGIQHVCSDVFHTPRTGGRPAPVFIVEAAQQFL